jgi:hypothetical protein
MRIIHFLAASLSFTLPTMAQSPFSASSSITTGWTSNATATSAGGSDIYIQHRHEARFAADINGLALRGTLGASGTRHLTLAAEDDWGVTGAMSAERRFGDIMLRGAFGLEHAAEGKHLLVAGVAVPLRTAKTLAETGIDAELTGEGRRTELSLTYKELHNGAAEFPTLPLAPVQIAADVGMITAAVRHEQLLSPELAVTLAAQYAHALVDDEAATIFGRMAVDRVALRAGFEARPWAGATASGNAGIALYWRQHGSDDVAALPVGQIELATPLIEQLRLEAGAKLDIDTFDPIDGATEQSLETILRLTHPGPWEATAFAEFAATATVGLVDAFAFEQRRRLAAGVTGSLPGGLGYRLEAGREWIATNEDVYVRDGLLVSISGGG